VSYFVGNYLVTGATGFIGRRLVERLSRENASIHCIVTTQRAQASRLPPMSGVIPVEVDTMSASQLRKAVMRIRPEVVVNLAAQGVDPDARDPESLLEGNVGILIQLLASLEECPPRAFLHMGSWSEYADPAGPTLITEDHAVLPLSLYGAAKAAATIYGNALAQRIGIPFVTLRLFNVFGIGENPRRLVPYLIRCLGRDESAELTPGDQTRDFLYVDDVVEAILVAASTQTLPSAVYNVCSSSPVELRHVAETVADIMGKPRGLLRFGSRPHRLDEPRHVVGDNTRFASATTWMPRVSLEDGIRWMVEAALGATPAREEL
jgi:nucleoside-diphosphate-sugar epimerase